MLGNDSTLNKQVQFIVYSLREAFIALVPFFILTSISTLILELLIQLSLFNDIQPIKIGVTLLRNTIPIMVLISVAHQLAKLKAIDSIVCIALSLSLLFSLQSSNITNLYASNSSFLSLLIPIFSTFFLARITNSQNLLSPKYAALDDNLRMIYRYTPAFIISYVVLLCLFFVIKMGYDQLYIYLASTFSGLEHHIQWMIVIRTLVSHLVTFVGVHGSFMFDIMVNSSYLYSPLYEHFTAKNFIDTFVIFGGVGSCLALAISILLYAKDQHAIKISKISMPFLVFNITEIILYGLPVVLNRRLFIPFILVPIINVGLALLFLHLFSVDFKAISLPWTTPIFISGYLATDGNWAVVLFQLLLITLDVMIYTLFVREYVRTQSSAEHLALLSNKLNISSGFLSKRSLKFQEAQTFLVNAHLDTHHIIQLITNNQLTVYYQPIVQVQQHTCHDYEALLRLRMQDGTILNPDFLPTLERAGLSTVIDLWVCRQVRADFLAWQAEGYHPNVSVNIHPDTFLDEASMQQIIDLLSGFNVQFEVIERAFLTPEKSDLLIKQLKLHGFKVAIDDFGTGYSTLENLHHMSADTIKFDKKLIDATAHEKGYKIYYHASRMCNDLGFTLVAEGIETEAQVQLIKQMGIQYIQGWYFAPALPCVEAKHFAESFNHNSNSTKT
jgi:lactose/cellobiose-specific phosphotransferase system IIC component